MISEAAIDALLAFALTLAAALIGIAVGLLTCPAALTGV